MTAADILAANASSNEYTLKLIDILRKCEVIEHSDGTAIPVPVFPPIATIAATDTTCTTGTTTAAVPTAVKQVPVEVRPQRRNKQRNSRTNSSMSSMSKIATTAASGDTPLEVGSTEPNEVCLTYIH
jgi:hypothetical protein